MTRKEILESLGFPPSHIPGRSDNSWCQKYGMMRVFNCWTHHPIPYPAYIPKGHYSGHGETDTKRLDALRPWKSMVDEVSENRHLTVYMIMCERKPNGVDAKWLHVVRAELTKDGDERYLVPVAA